MREKLADADLIVSSYNNGEAIVQILSFLSQGSVTPQKVHIADDGSSKNSLDLIKNKLLRFAIPVDLHWQEDRGFRKARALNSAIRACESKYVVFLDGDCLPHKHFVRDHLAMAEKGYFVQGRRCFVRENQVVPLLEGKTSLLRLMLSGKVSGLLKSIRLPKPIVRTNKDMYGLLGCNLGAWRGDLLAVNGFDEDYEGWGREDSDLGARLYNLGLRRKMVYGRALVYHLNHPENKRDKLEQNDRRLEATISSGKKRCSNGIARESPKTS
jgi:GT2 family glycosyltransferase